MAKKKSPHIVEDTNDIDDSDDEEIDEDEAFNSEDELKYGAFFSSSKSKKRKEKVKKIGEDDDDDDGSDASSSGGDDDDSGGSDGSESDEHDWAGTDDEEEEDDDGGQYMLDLLQNLDKQVKNEKLGKKSDDNDGKKDKAGSNARINMENVPAAAVHLEESEFQAGTIANRTAEDGGVADGKLTLDALIGGISDTQGFATVQRTMRVLSSGNQVQMKGGDGQNDVDGPSKMLTTTPAPLPRVVSERTSRKVHYESTSKDVSQWQTAVHSQRDAETLDFRPNQGQQKGDNRLTRSALVSKFEARGEFEEELARALEVAGMEDEKAAKRKEKKRLLGKDGEGEALSDDDSAGDTFDDKDAHDSDDDLGSNRISLEEYKKRHGELAKMRALLFYEEQKRHRINKIKSKKYRKIRKRQRERQKDAEDEAARMEDPSLDREKLEKEEMDRMQERMTLAHKNTSKWARRVLRRGAKMDVEERRALSLQIAKGEELRRKVMGEDGQGGEDDSHGEETEEDLLRKARDILMEDEDGDGVPEETKKKGLFQLEFMKRGMETQRARAKEEARRLLEELEANEAAAVSTDSESEDDYDKMEKGSVEKKPAVASEEEMKKLLPEGKLVASSLQFGKSDGFAIAIDGNIELGGAKNEETKETNQSSVEPTAQSSKKKKKKKKNKKGGQNAAENEANEVKKTANSNASQAARSNAIEEEEENPWLVAKNSHASADKKQDSEKTNKTTPSLPRGKHQLSRTVNISDAASMLVNDTGKARTSSASKRKRSDEDETDDAAAPTERENDASTSDAGIASLSQAELVRRAFAAPADLEAEEEFEKEKERMKERDDPTRQKKEEKFVTGWGSWAGAGAPPPKKPKKLPKHLSAPLKKVDKAPARKDDGLKKVIINEKRLKKTAKFQLSEIPYPYRSRQEYEKAIAGNIGPEWNTIQGVKEMTRPAVIVRAGKIIKPIAKKAKAKRAPAKF